MVIALLSESDLSLANEVIETIVDKVRCFHCPRYVHVL